MTSRPQRLNLEPTRPTHRERFWVRDRIPIRLHTAHRRASRVIFRIFPIHSRMPLRCVVSWDIHRVPWSLWAKAMDIALPLIGTARTGLRTLKPIMMDTAFRFDVLVRMNVHHQNRRSHPLCHHLQFRQMSQPMFVVISRQ